MLSSLKNSAPNIGLQVLPFTPVSFSSDPMIAYGRIALYGALSYITWKKARKVSYGLMSAAGLSLLTSLSSEAVKPKSTPAQVTKAPAPTQRGPEMPQVSNEPLNKEEYEKLQKILDS